ncbi:SGT1 domain containing protein [Trichuris trichiura]|uniref:SGT1 domain containing protein n=1 Tax=Trichuris trichiura TaxID=36087 RepID=A0A077ZBP4_TRITR|nr:SGT1 domain containing protein [Trichuris trichiura]
MTSPFTEDVVEYWFYFLSEQDCPTLSNVLAMVHSLSENYIWYDECFCLIEKDVPVRHFYGKVHYGSCDKDEEFVVFLLMQISKTYPNVVVKTCDYDGEFLLIWAAEALPYWLTPENAINRVFIFNGSVCLIPRRKDVRKQVSDWPKKLHSLQEALDLIRRYPQLCLAPIDVRQAIDSQLSGYPEKVRQDWHSVYCMLPVKLASLLKLREQAIAPAVRAFCCRDYLSMKCFKNPRFPPANLVRRKVRFTKMLYAMLALDNFEPPPRSDWKLPSCNDATFKAYNIGMRVTIGFELLCAQARDAEFVGVNKLSSESSLWQRFLTDLKNRGYFKNEIVGSAGYCRLLEAAKEFFKNVTQNDDKPSDAVSVVRLLEKLEFAENANVEAATVQDNDSGEEDNDEWLNVKYEDLNEMFKQQTTSFEPFVPNEFRRKVSKFIEQESSSIAGVCPSEKSRGLNITKEVFERSMRRMIDLAEEDDDDDDEAASDSDSMQEYDTESTDSDEHRMLATNAASTWSKELLSYMAEMDRELLNTTVGESFIRDENRGTQDAERKNNDEENIDLENDSFQPVNVDKTLVSNMLQSYRTQGGETGPAATLLMSLHIRPPDEPRAQVSDDEESEERLLNSIS